MKKDGKEKAEDKVLYLTVYFYRCVELELHPAATLEEAQDKMEELTESDGYRDEYDGLDIETVVLTPELLASLEPVVVAQQGGEKA